MNDWRPIDWALAAVYAAAFYALVFDLFFWRT